MEDRADEPDETFGGRVTGALNATVGDDTATATIRDDDLPRCTLIQTILELVGAPQNCQ